MTGNRVRRDGLTTAKRIPAAALASPSFCNNILLHGLEVTDQFLHMAGRDHPLRIALAEG
jgi:hypothetical protein